ncbi:MAG TPA: hypothetical protein VKQ72_01565 [Aggregatilineales bacterium]|nr:hypothetical protein [Aggregatilineales bacterium]
MGIKLDWQVEADTAYQRAGEDPEQQRRRRQQGLRLLFFTLGIILAVCVLAGVVWNRLYTVDDQLRRELLSTVQAEDATLRLGDYAQFIAIQRSANDIWIQEQGQRFKRYQDLKTKSNLVIDGTVLNSEVDGQRGRALILETLDSKPYHTVWFYWRFPEGWRHVPSDFTFWGNSESVKSDTTVVNYSQVDAELGQALATRVQRWWPTGCATLGCSKVPVLTVEILPNQRDQPDWEPSQPETLIVPSPLSVGDRASADVVISPTLEDAVAKALADHEFSVASNKLIPTQTADAAWLRQMIVEWLASAFTGRGDPNDSFAQSLNDHYGSAGLSAVVHALTPTSDIGILGTALKQPIESLALDWRTFFQWRLDIEKTLLQNNDINGFQALWDSANPTALAQMRQRMINTTQATPQVQAVSISTGQDGVAQASVKVTANGQPATIIFRLVNRQWKRSG